MCCNRFDLNQFGRHLVLPSASRRFARHCLQRFGTRDQVYLATCMLQQWGWHIAALHTAAKVPSAHLLYRSRQHSEHRQSRVHQRAHDGLCFFFFSWQFAEHRDGIYAREDSLLLAFLCQIGIPYVLGDILRREVRGDGRLSPGRT